MNRTLPLAASALLASAAAAVGLGTMATAAPRTADLAVSGFVAGGERTVESFHPVVFVLNLRNNGPRAVDSSADMGYLFVHNGTVTDQLCVFPTGASFDPDSPDCEYGALGVGQVANMTLIVQPRRDVTGVAVSVKVCSSNESGIPDPVSSNDCATLRVGL